MSRPSNVGFSVRTRARTLPLGALLGADIGPLVMPFGALATILVISVARREGAKTSASCLIHMGVWVSAVVFGGTLAALWRGDAIGLM